MSPSQERLTAEAFIARLRAEGQARYHDRHPFHLAMHRGELTQAQLQAWVANRYYYQTRIPIKDALILSKSEDPGFRRIWMQRIADHDGLLEDEGGLALWLRLAAGVGLHPGEVTTFQHVLPAVRFACDAYVDLVRQRTLLEAVASSLTEFFSPDLLTRRVLAWEEHYPWVDRAVLEYFRSRPRKAQRDSEHALACVTAWAHTREQQERCLEALVKKCEILWALLDAVQAAHPLESIGAAVRP